MRLPLAGLLLVLVLIGVGCSGRDPNRKETVPVIGVITVDGKPAESVQITFHPEGGMDQTQPTETRAMSAADGKFAATTYELGDGATLGKFKLTFKLPKLNSISMTFDGDAFKGRYANPEKSQHSIEVVSGMPIDLGTIELSGR
ncbi:MAG: hypothetical protein KDB03_02045 [Planctomycetales bacterium]|nr:hypothetical protein [Planctomycetales bacterium]